MGLLRRYLLYVLPTLVALAVLGPSVAQAHTGSAIEELVQVAVNPADPNVMVLRYAPGGEGLLYTRDGGQRWQMICGSAIDPELTRDSHAMVAADGTAMLGTFTGLKSDDSRGCGWSDEPLFANSWVADVVADPMDSHVLYASLAALGDSGKGGMARRNGDGEWALVGELEQGAQVTRVRAVQTDAGMRFVQQLRLGERSVEVDGVEMMVPDCQIRHSDDGGESWQSHECMPTRGQVYLQAVDPTNPDRFLVSVHEDGMRDVLYVTQDAGQSYQEYYSLTNLGGAVVTADGRVFLGDSGAFDDSNAPKGLFAAKDLDTPPSAIADYSVNCLHHDPESDTLRLCQRFWFGSADPKTGEYTIQMSIAEVEEFVQCEGQDVAASCEPQLCDNFCSSTNFPNTPVCDQYTSTEDCGACAGPGGCPDPEHGGMPPAGEGTDPSTPATEASGCQLGSTGGAQPLLWLLLLSLWSGLRRRRA